MQQTNIFEQIKNDWRGLYRLCGVGALVLLVYCLATIIIMAITGGQPATVEETLTMLQGNRLVGLLRMDLLTVLVMPLYYVLFLGFLVSLWRAHLVNAVLAFLLVLTGVTLFLAMPSVFSYAFLSDRLAQVAGDAQRAQILAAGEAIQAADMWRGTGAMVGGLLTQTGAVLISFVMLRGTVFGKAAAWMGIITHGLDLLHILVGFFAPELGILLMIVAGPLYLIWFPLVARGFWRLAKEPTAARQPRPVMMNAAD